MSVSDAVEVAARERLEDHGCLSGRLQAELGVERDGRGREREEPVVLGLGELLPPEEDVAETQGRPARLGAA